MSNDDMKKNLYLHLHEQYATNNNANLTTVMTLVVALVAVIGYYGYIFIHTSTDNINKDKTELAYNVINKTHFQDGDIYVTNKTYVNQAKKSQGSFYDAQSETYSLEALSLIYCGSIFILGILFCVCTYQGIAQRKEQFIIYAIRQRYDVFTNVILPDGYHPFNKKGLAVIQGLYGELVKIFMIVAMILTILTGYRLFPIYGIIMRCALVVTLVLPLILFEYQKCNKVLCRKICNKICSFIKKYGNFTLIILTLIVVLTFVFCKKTQALLYMTNIFPFIVFICSFSYFIKQYESYIDRQLEYTKMKYPEADGNRITEIKNKNCLCKICEGEKYIQELEKDRKDKG